MKLLTIAQADDDLHATEPWIRTGKRVLLTLVAGFCIFGLVSISSAVVAPGVVNVETNYKAVQHLDGGIVSKILVRNGDRVEKGDVLVRLDDTAARTNLGVIVSRINDQRAQIARLSAERDRAPAIDLPADLVTSSDPALQRLIEAQQKLFSARSASYRGELSVLKQRLEQATNEASGIEQLLDARRREVELNAVEYAAVKPLFDRGYASQQRIMPIQREGARLAGDVGKLETDLAKSKSAIAESELRITQKEKEYTQSVVDELRKSEALLAELDEQRTQLNDKLQRIELRSPRAGRVHALAAHTEGGVIQPGSTVLQIIPEGELLIVDAQLQPNDIDKVHQGQAAYVRFPAFNAKTTPRLEATVLNVSAAQLADQQGKTYFTAQVMLTTGELSKLPKGRDLVPGMPAEVYIATGSRSILSYLLKPLSDALSRTFRET